MCMCWSAAKGGRRKSGEVEAAPGKVAANNTSLCVGVCMSGCVGVGVGVRVRAVGAYACVCVRAIEGYTCLLYVGIRVCM